jgi:hypothetical protein
MRRLWIFGLSLAMAAGFVHAQQATQPTDANAPVPADQFSSKMINPPRLLNPVDPDCSVEARSGRCLIALTVGVNGALQEVKLVRCTNPSFEKCSLETASKYRFKPATTKEGKPVSTTISVEFNHRKDSNDFPMPVRWGFSSPPGITTIDPGADGVYPLTRKSVPPVITGFVDSGYGNAAFLSPKGNGACDIVLTISIKGKASDQR